MSFTPRWFVPGKEQCMGKMGKWASTTALPCRLLVIFIFILFGSQRSWVPQRSGKRELTLLLCDWQCCRLWQAIFHARLDNNGNKTSSLFYQIQYLPSLVRKHDSVKLPILPSIFLSHLQLSQTKCWLILQNLLGNTQSWKCLPYSVLCPTCS